ncbi:hypothetical protein, partial [Priestia megaterium]|uniref:hypothetical protein n=1 Tax=Priestia megaterium TaxID=1404 RepID=UPI001B3B2EAD
MSKRRHNNKKEIIEHLLDSTLFDSTINTNDSILSNLFELKNAKHQKDKCHDHHDRCHDCCDDCCDDHHHDCCHDCGKKKCRKC